MEDTKSAEDCSKPYLFTRLRALFCDHPAQAGETYTQHLLFTLGMAGKLIGSGLALLIHGILPFTFVHTASKAIRESHVILDERAVKTGGIKKEG